MTTKRGLEVLERAAYHEAGHAVAAYLVNLRFNKVSITSNDGLLARCNFTKRPKNFYQEHKLSPKTRNLIEKEVSTIVAGHLVEQLFIGNADWIASDHDVMMAHTLLDKLCVSSEETTAYLNWLWVRMKNQIQLPLNWAMVEALANMLLEHKELDGPVSRAVFRETEKTWMRIRHQAIDE